MNSKRFFVFLLLVAALPLASCSGLHSTCTTNCTSGNAKLTITMWDTPPAGMTLLSFTLPIAGITLTPSTGSPIAITPLVSSVEATRLQTDTALLVDALQIPAGTYTTLSVTLGPTSATSNVFINYSTAPIIYTLNGSSFTCQIGAVCNLPVGAVFTIPITVNTTVSSNQDVWVGLNLNLSNAITTSGGLSVDFSQANVLTATNTIRTGLPSGAADTVEDFVGQVTALSSTSISVQNGVSGQTLIAALTSTTEYDSTLPTGNNYSNCGSSTQGCLKVGSTVSMDTTISSGGVITATEVDILDATAVDEIEGIIYPASNGTTCPVNSCFGLILADKTSVSGNSVLSASTTTWGTGIFINSATLTTNFAIDTKTLTSQFSSPPVGFAGVGDLLAGQQVRIQVSNMTSANNQVFATATNVLLRYSRLTGVPSNVGTLAFNFAPPMYITQLDTGFGSTPLAVTFVTTEFDGVTNTPSIANSPIVSIRALFLDNTQNPFLVAKVRVP
jgi:hypothetical protein